MSIKDFFGKSSEKVITNKDQQVVFDEVESEGFLEQNSEDSLRFLPAIDFSTASNFSKYGSAKTYYSDSLKNIYLTYPYDGSKKEKLEWRNVSSQFDLYVFDELYPKTTGYITLGSSSWNNYAISSLTASNNVYRVSSAPQYISVNGGPNTSSTGKFEDANLYDTASNRESNLAVNPLNLGNSIEFWFKEEAETSSSYALFDLWNGNTIGSHNYTRFLLEKVRNGSFYITYMSGTSGVSRAEVSHNFDRYNWHHYGFSVRNSGSSLNIAFYVDGELENSFLTGTSISPANNYGSTAFIGAFRTSPIQEWSTASWSGRGSVYGSYDEFRFWKEFRTHKNVKRNWFTNVGGGSNTDDSNTELGIYYKFNEGIISTSSANSNDSRCLDYSGRISNGTIVNYTVDVRSTGSAIESFSSDFVEEADPIVYSSNPRVSETISIYEESGSFYDEKNTSNIYNTLPSWITEEHEDKNIEDLRRLTQIIASYFDTLHLQIENLPRIKDVKYLKENDKPIPFMNKILNSYGFENVDIFSDTTLIEELLSRNETKKFETTLFNVKNLIYQNIFNNLSYIYKSKGTENSIRNLIRCFGVDDELVKINLYSNNSEYTLKDNYQFVSIPKKYIDFNDPDRYEGMIYQKSISGDPNTKSYISGSNSGILNYVPITLQAEVIFPKKVMYDDPNYDIPDFSKVSLFGAHTAKEDQTDLTWGSDEFNFQVYAQKRNFESQDVYFILTGSLSGSGFNLTSSWFNETYDNNKWNLAVRLKPNKIENVNLVNGSTIGDYTLEFIGYNSTLETIDNSFALSTSISSSNAQNALKKNKRIYVGAHYENFDEDPSNLLCKTDVKISSVRFWFDYLDDDEIKTHSFDASSFGRKFPYWSAYLADSNTKNFNITKADTLALNWDFSLVSSSDSNGQFIVEDSSSGSLAAVGKYGIGLLGQIINYRHTGFGTQFYENDTQVVNKEYIYSAKLQQPESIAGSDLIQIRDTDDISSTRDTKPITYYYAVEKSMYQIINNEILNWFATIQAFNNLIGDPAERYRKEYKSLRQLRKIFFEKVENEPNFERFMDFYKWIDSSISLMINQLIPASANFSENVRNIVESHLLERNKYENKLPSLLANKEIISTTTNPLNFTYSEQAAANNPTGSLWLKTRVERTSPLVSSGDVNVDNNREQIRKVLISKNLNKVPKQYGSDANTFYEGKSDIVRGFSNLSSATASILERPEKIINPINTKNSRFYSEFKFAESTVTSSGQVIVPETRIGNYQHTYEYFQTSGRSKVNLGLVDILDNLTQSNSPQRTLPTRPVIKSVIVERFSAPGGAEVMSRGALDAESEEFSAYNSLNNRNLVVRRELNKWLAESSSINPEFPSYHKVNKNTGYRINPSGQQIAKYDNEFLTRQIPRSDSQYSWITASLLSKPSSSVFLSEYDNLNSYKNSSLQFLSASTSGSFVLDFIGLNNNLLTLADTASNTLSASNSLFFTSSQGLNKYLLGINGPYAGASWKFLRNAENKVVRVSRKNNKILVQDPSKQTRVVVNVRTNDGKTFKLVNFSPKKSSTFTSYREPPISFNRPVKHILRISGSTAPVEVISTYENNKEKFGNENLMKVLGTKERNELQTFDIIKNLEHGYYEPRPQVVSIEKTEDIYPQKREVGSALGRTRPGYEDYINNSASVINTKTFWKDSYINRARLASTTDIFNFVTESTYAAIENFTCSIFGRYPIEHNVAIGNFRQSIFSLDNSTGAVDDYTATIREYARSDFDVINPLLSSSVYYNNMLKGHLSPFSLSEHRYFILGPSGPFATIQTRDYTEPFVGFNYSQKRFLPRPQLVFTNFITPSTGSGPYGGMYFPKNINRANLTHDVLLNGANPETLFFINDGYIYETPEISGKKPFFDSYELFAEDIKPKSQKYFLVPEYRISDFMEFFVKQKNGDFSVIPTGSYLFLDGASSEYLLASDINSNSNTSNEISNTITKEIEEKDKTKISLKMSAIKKLLPYRGFYPSERIVQLSSLFINSFIKLNQDFKGYSSIGADSASYDFNLSNGTPIDQQILTLIQPLFAPGILLNTIKSSIAVDWPTFITNSVKFYDSSTSSRPKLPTFYSTGSSTDYHHLYTSSVFIGKEQNFRFPFEALLEFDTIIPETLKEVGNSLYYLDPTHYCTDAVSGSARQSLAFPQYDMTTGSLKNFTFNDPLYKLAMHNFLAEIPSFFLKDTLNSFTSLPEDEFEQFVSGTAYYMDVVLQRDQNYKEFIADPYYELRKRNNSTFAAGYIVQQSPDSLYGPPTAFYNNITGWEPPAGLIYYSRNNAFAKLHDSPAYAPYVPPYYYGKSIARISFIPEETRMFGLTEILDNLKINYINKEAEGLFRLRSNFLDANFSGPYVDKYSSSPAFKQMMTLSSSLNLKIKTPVKLVEFDARDFSVSKVTDRENQVNSWVIQTKFETPSINFAQANTSGNIGFNKIGAQIQGDSYVDGIYSNLFKGLWTTYGTPVQEGEGIKFYLQESFQNTSSLTQSLIQACGFKKDEKKTVGLLGETKIISEGILVIPYTFQKNHGPDMDNRYAETLPELLGENRIYRKTQRGVGPYYFKTDRNIISKLLNLPFSQNSRYDQKQIEAVINSPKVSRANSIINSIYGLQNYVIPPHLDWLRSRAVSPFAMYFFEFNSVLDREDLSDIWQGLMPKPALNIEEENTVISHDLIEEENFHGKLLPPEVRFKIFKVKKRANINYYKLTADSKDDERFKFKFSNSQEERIPQNSFNYPYDYFSLIEMANLETTLLIEKGTKKNELVINPNDIIDALSDANPEEAIKNLKNKK